jgi:hypothetical protein
MPRTNVVGTTAAAGSGAQRCAQAGERKHRTDSTTGTAVTTAANRLSDVARGRRAQLEAQWQRSLVEHLHGCARSDVWWCAIPNGGWRSPIEAAIMKGLGTRAGAPDLLIVRAGQPIFIECKAPGRKLTPAQIECHEALRRASATVETFDNIDAALAFLRRLGVLK